MSLLSTGSVYSVSYTYNCSYKNAELLLRKEIKKRKQKLCFPIYYTTLLICKTLFLSNNEVNLIIARYLSLWNKHPNVECVYRSEIEECFSPDNRGFVTAFFLDEKVSCNDFVLFVFFFLFYTKEDILNVLIAMVGINSKLFITKELIILFFNTYNLDITNYCELVYMLDLSKPILPNYPSEAYSLKTFQTSLIHNKSFLSELSKLKEDISNLTIDYESVDKIILRMSYYNKLLTKSEAILEKAVDDKIDIKEYPRESCTSKLNRFFFSNKPNPYHYDFSIVYLPETAKNDVILQIKQRFHLSKKDSLTCFKISFNKNSQQPSNNIIIYPSTNSPSDPGFRSPLYSNRSNNKVYPYKEDF